MITLVYLFFAWLVIYMVTREPKNTSTPMPPVVDKDHATDVADEDAEGDD